VEVVVTINLVRAPNHQEEKEEEVLVDMMVIIPLQTLELLALIILVEVEVVE
jgi:hypothetical protein